MTSKTGRNPGRQFVHCRWGGCNRFAWLDEPSPKCENRKRVREEESPDDLSVAYEVIAKLAIENAKLKRALDALTK